MNGKRLVLLSVICLLICVCAPPLRASDFSFVFMSDNAPWRTSDGITQNEYFLGNIERTNGYNSDFVVLGGDHILGYVGSNSALLHAKWDAYDDTCENFMMPSYSIVGNHDVYNSQSESIWISRYGDLYFSWNHMVCVEAFCLSTNDTFLIPILDLLTPLLIFLSDFFLHLKN